MMGERYALPSGDARGNPGRRAAHRGRMPTTRARPVQPSLFRPPIARLPRPDQTAPDRDELRDLLLRSRAWERQAEPLPRSMTCALWVTVAGAGGVGSLARHGAHWHGACSGVVCTIATLGDRPRLLLVLAAFCVTALLGLAPFTRGLTRAGGLQLALMVVAAVSGVVSLLGVAAVVVLTVLVASGGAVALVLLLDRD